MSVAALAPTAIADTGERALVIDCQGEKLIGVVSPAAGGESAASRTGVLIAVGGPQYRAGSHRQFVLLARHLAADGFTVLRFDCRGMGDSEGTQRSFEQLGGDIAAAIDALIATEPGVRRVVLWGLCDAASAALLYLHERPDPRVVGLALLNPWVRSSASLARTHVKHYYRERLLQPAFWRKLLTGGIALDALTGLVRNLRVAFSTGPQAAAAGHEPYQQRMARAWEAFDRPVLLMLSENDLTAREFGEYAASNADWQRAMSARPPQRVAIAGADHTCSAPAAQRAVESATAHWLRDTLGPA